MAREMAREIAARGGPLRRAGGGAARRPNPQHPHSQGGRRGGEGVIGSGMRVVVMGNGGCRRQQREHWGEVSGGDWPPAQFEELVHEGNAKLREWCVAAQLAARRDAPLAAAPTLEAVLPEAVLPEAAPPQGASPQAAPPQGAPPQLPRAATLDDAARTALGGWLSPPLFLERAPSMESVPRLSGSPCFHHHPYGRLSDTHVQIVLNALCG